jgi:glycosyltransferase involved in cell wall biosynthesis
MNPSVSVTICCYNGEKYLETALQSVIAQTYTNWEIIIINDGSTDTTEAIVKKYISKGYPITYHYQANAGLGSARNKSIELAKGDFIAILDQDDLWYPSKLEKQMVLFKNNPGIGVVYADCNLIDESGLVKLKSSMNGEFHEGDVFSNLLRDMFTPAWPTVIMRKLLIKNAGGFLNYSFAEDLDILLKIAYVSSFGVVKEVLASYRLHSNQSSKRYYKYLPELNAIFDYWSNRTDFKHPNQIRYIAKFRSKQFRLCAESAFDQLDDMQEARWYLYESLKFSFSVKIFVLLCLSWLNPQTARKLLKYIRLLLSSFK